MFVLTHKVRLKVRSKRQCDALQNALTVTRTLYNAALEERSGAWTKAKSSISKYDQMKSITALAGDPSLGGLPVNLLRWPSVKLDLAFKGFFDRVKKGETPGYPRFRSKDRFDAFGYTDRQCWKVDPDRGYVHLSRIGSYRLQMHRPIIGEIRSLQIEREGSRWFALIGVKTPVSLAHANDDAVGIDLGIRHHLTLSSGETVENLRHADRHTKAVKSAQRKLARARRGSRSRTKRKADVAALKRHETNARRTRLHQISANLTRRFSTLVVEKLIVQNMTRSAAGTVDAPGVNVAAKRRLNRSIQDASWGILVNMLTYKAERAGGTVIKVDPRNTSQMCSGCGSIVPKSLSQLRHVCACGVDLDRDHNAALNVLHRGVVTPGDAKPAIAPVRLRKVA